MDGSPIWDLKACFTFKGVSENVSQVRFTPKVKTTSQKWAGLAGLSSGVSTMFPNVIVNLEAPL